MSNLTYDQISFKASHNSYDRNESIAQQLTFHPSDPSNCGCLGLELDIWRHTMPYVPYGDIPADYFVVSHIINQGDTLASYLQQILTWHDQNASHDPILVTIDIKSSQGSYDHFHDAFDTYLKKYFREDLIFKPAKLMKDAALSLCSNVVKTGWPTVSSAEMKGKFVFCLSGNSAWKAEYAHNDLKVRYAFSDKDESDFSKAIPPATGDIVFFNFHIFDGSHNVWMEAIQPYSKFKLITRTYIADSDANFSNSIRANVSAIATNKISGHSWAKVSETAPYVEKTQQYDKRSLKNKANNEYRTGNATSMQDTYESPYCTFIFEPYQSGSETVYAIRSAWNNEYFDCSISSMSKTVNGNCQKWKLETKDAAKNEYYVKNMENNEYMTKRASKLSDSKGNEEVYIIESVV